VSVSFFTIPPQTTIYQSLSNPIINIEKTLIIRSFQIRLFHVHSPLFAFPNTYSVPRFFLPLPIVSFEIFHPTLISTIYLETSFCLKRPLGKFVILVVLRMSDSVVNFFLYYCVTSIMDIHGESTEANLGLTEFVER